MIDEYPLVPIIDCNISNLKYFPKGVVVFDRDETLINDCGQHNDVSQMHFMEGALDAILFLKKQGYGIAIASNQAGLSSGKFTLETLQKFHDHLQRSLFVATGFFIDVIAICPHLEMHGCNCRKPGTGLLKEIENITASPIRVFIGDKATDAAAAQNFGIESILVKNNMINEQIHEWSAQK
jgi:histidinol-phosphate phosphatase family protein